jgi:hypothetical protein
MDKALFVAIAGAFSLIPYGILVLVAIVWLQPKQEGDFWQLVWLAPSWIAFPFALLFGLYVLVQAGWDGALRAFTAAGLLAIGVGYVYAIAINARSCWRSA